MKSSSRSGLFSFPAAAALLVGAVLVPTALSITVGIVSLALWQDAADIVNGVLVICFATTVVFGGIATLVLLRKWHRLARLQSDFMANMSHEINTPLTAIRLFVDTLRLGRVQTPEEVRSCLDTLAQETERLSTQIGRILQWRRMEVGAERILRRPERIEDIVSDALGPLSAMCTLQGSRLELQAEADLPPVLADRRALAEALQNVVHNAIKYGGHAGPVKVSIRAGSRGKEVQVEVLDHGPGIPQKEQKHVFERFYRGDEVQIDADLPGAGLGLSITRHVIKAHAGRIELESYEGWGTRVTICLAAAPVQPDGAVASMKQIAAGSERTADLLLEGSLVQAEPDPPGEQEPDDLDEEPLPGQLLNDPGDAPERKTRQR